MTPPKLRDPANASLDRIAALIARAKRPAVAWALVALAAILAAALIFQLEGCALSWGGAEPIEVGALEAGDLWTAEDCRGYDAAHVGLTIAASAAAGLSGATGLALAVWPDPTRAELIGLGVAGVALGAAGAALAGAASLYAQRFAERCTDQSWMGGEPADLGLGPAATPVP